MSTEVKRYIFDSEEAWLDYRTGIFTASEVDRLLAAPTKKDKEAGEVLSKGAKTYILEKVSAMLGSPKPSFFNAEMQWGKDTEPEAAFNFCEAYGYEVTSDDVIYTSQGGLVFFSNDRCGGTPDIILPDGLVEIKCPNSVTQLRNKLFLTADNIEEEYPNYYAQMQLNMWLCKRDMTYFVSYDPRLKKGNMHVIEVKRNEQFVTDMLTIINVAHDYKLQLLERI